MIYYCQSIASCCSLDYWLLYPIADRKFSCCVAWYDSSRVDVVFVSALISLSRPKLSAKKVSRFGYMHDAYAKILIPYIRNNILKTTESIYNIKVWQLTFRQTGTGLKDD
jgi:hypothetical protein